MQTYEFLQLLEQETGSSTWLVGGVVRDLLLNRESRDMDLVVRGSARKLVSTLAKQSGARAVLLDPEHDVMRVIVNGTVLDISGLGENSLEEDLQRRDFTINAMALPLPVYLWGGDPSEKIIDPLGGINDLQRKIIRACNPSVFEDDPLRVLRALRLQAGLGFTVTETTRELLGSLQKSWSAVPGERIWEELSHIFNLPCSFEVIRFLEQETNTWGQLFPEASYMRRVEQNYYHADNVWEHSLKSLYYLEYFLEQERLPGGLSRELSCYLQESLNTVRKRRPVVKLACLFHDAGKLTTRGVRGDGRVTFYGHHRAGGPVAEKIGQRLKLSRREIKLLRLLVEQHMQPLFLYKESPLPVKGVTRFFRSLGEEVPGCLLLSLADITSSRMATGNEEQAREYYHYITEMLGQYFKEKEKILHSSSLLNGREICRLFGLNPSPLVGKLKKELLEAQLEGKVKNRREAVQFVDNILDARGKK